MYVFSALLCLCLLRMYCIAEFRFRQKSKGKMRKENEREQGKEIVALLQVCRLTQLCLFKTRLDNNLAMLEPNIFLQTNNFLGAWVITFN